MKLVYLKLPTSFGTRARARARGQSYAAPWPTVRAALVNVAHGAHVAASGGPRSRRTRRARPRKR